MYFQTKRVKFLKILSLGMKTNEVNKLLMGLNIFPDLLTNVEITRIVDQVLPESTSSSMKSPRMMNREIEKKDNTLSYSDFETMIVKIAYKAFRTPENSVPFYSISNSFRVQV